MRTTTSKTREQNIADANAKIRALESQIAACPEGLRRRQLCAQLDHALAYLERIGAA